MKANNRPNLFCIKSTINNTVWACIFLITLLCIVETNAQNLDAIGQKDPLKISGGLNFNNVFYHVDGIEARRVPYTYFLTGNLTFDLYGWVVPVSFTYSNQNTSFQQPFNQYSIHPKYKWATAHIGYTSMTFSPYTLNGHIFKGVGLDLAPPGKFKISAMYGRLQKAVEADTLRNDTEAAAFQRMGYGFKVGYAESGGTVDVILFHAQDQLKSINSLMIPEDLRPQENLVLSIAGSKTILKKLLVQAEIATSALTRDTRAENFSSQYKNLFSYAAPLYTTRTTTSYYKAFKTGLSYQGNTYTVGVGYEFVEPEYRTLGSYYFNNDLENITVNATKVLFKGKVNIAGNGGVQRDNLDNTKVSTMKRFVGSLNVGYTPSDRLSLSGAYSNFRTYTNIRSQFLEINQLTPYDNLDTLNYTQLSQSANANANYMLGKSEKYKQRVNLNVSFQDAADEQGGVRQSSGSQFYNLNSSYNINLVPSSMGVSVAFNFNQNKMATLSTNTFGPTIGLQKSFLDKKFRVSASTSLNSSYNNNVLVSKVVSFRLGGNYAVKKKHNLMLSAIVLNRNNTRAQGTEKFTEYTGNLSYSYSF